MTHGMKGKQNALKGSQVASKHIHIRVDPDLLKAAQIKAQSEGVTFSAWLTGLIKQKIE